MLQGNYQYNTKRINWQKLEISAEIFYNEKLLLFQLLQIKKLENLKC